MDHIRFSMDMTSDRYMALNMNIESRFQLSEICYISVTRIVHRLPAHSLLRREAVQNTVSSSIRGSAH